MSDRAQWRPMTEPERAMARALGRCSYQPASMAKRFARDLAGQAEMAEPKITDKQLVLLRSFITKYRRQIRHEQLHEIDRDLLGHPPKKPRSTT